MARAGSDSQIRFAAQAFVLEVVFLSVASFCSIGYRSDLLGHSFQPFALIALTALAMGTRNAAARKLAIPDLTTTVLTLTITGIGADSSMANGNNPRLARRVESVVAMFLGAALGAVIIRYSISAALWLGQRSPPCAVRHCFARCARAMSCDGESHLSAGELYRTHGAQRFKQPCCSTLQRFTKPLYRHLRRASPIVRCDEALICATLL